MTCMTANCSGNWPRVSVVKPLYRTCTTAHFCVANMQWLQECSCWDITVSGYVATVNVPAVCSWSLPWTSSYLAYMNSMIICRALPCQGRGWKRILSHNRILVMMPAWPACVLKLHCMWTHARRLIVWRLANIYLRAAASLP